MATTGRFGKPAAGDLLTVSFDARYLVRLTDATTRRFKVGLQGQLARAHQKIAQKMLEAVADKLSESMDDHYPHRPQREGNRLRTSILAEENRSVTATGFAVGFEKWMNESPAELYWRGIEKGIGAYETRGFFTDEWPGGKLYGPGRGGPHMRMPQFRDEFVTKGGHTMMAPKLSVKAFPGYNYFAELPVAFGRMDIAGFYRAEGVPIEQFLGAGKK